MENRRATRPRFRIEEYMTHEWERVVVDSEKTNMWTMGGDCVVLACLEEDAGYICAALNAADRREKESSL